MLGGISSVARKWMARNGLQASELTKVFSLGVDEIDLVAKTVPGKSKRERMRNVFLLRGVAAYLGTGAARFSHEQVKEACLHYDAFDATNFAAHFKSLSNEVSGSRDTGYTLCSRPVHRNGTRKGDHSGEGRPSIAWLSLLFLLLRLCPMVSVCLYSPIS
jgi:hypothetical protein